ncbi:MAG TPA: glutamate-5-semialdehyde dehydrogenase, partial [Elusimicrobiales bacterium]|nr:glutamate-5-semialdehyde dehydrogenase [Elusimicrobiales bacterium]
GVIGIIYESRPNVTADCAALCLKSGNAVVLKGGREAACSNAAIYTALRRGIAGAGLPGASVTMIDPADRKSVGYLLKMDRYLDLVIPRGGEGLIRAVVENSRVPVIKHYKGVCHVYVDGKADIGKAVRICVNAKVQRPGVCNAMEALLVDRRIARRFLPVIVGEMRANGVEIRGCRATRAIVPGTKPAKASDFGQEFLDLVLAVRVVDGVGGAAAHIAEYGSGHSDAIVTEDRSASRRFLAEVDSACVYSNASTRFTDGCQFGFGAEIGISTDKIHARGPMALEELTSYKYVVTGNGQIRD